MSEEQNKESAHARENTSYGQALAKLHNMAEQVREWRIAKANREALEDPSAYDKADGAYDDAVDAAEAALEAVEQEAQSDILSVELRGPWQPASGFFEGPEDAPADIRILLCWGGPAVQVTGHYAGRVRLEHQDWGTGWEAINLGSDDAIEIVCGGLRRPTPPPEKCWVGEQIVKKCLRDFIHMVYPEFFDDGTGTEDDT